MVAIVARIKHATAISAPRAEKSSFDGIESPCKRGRASQRLLLFPPNFSLSRLLISSSERLDGVQNGTGATLLASPRVYCSLARVNAFRLTHFSPPAAQPLPFPASRFPSRPISSAYFD